MRTLLTILMLAASTSLWALNSDRNEPATVEADEVEYDFRTGVRTYKGNVVVIRAR